MKINRFEEIIAWQKAKQFTVQIYKLFEDSRDYGFKDQIQRACVSIMNNIAEGFERRSNNKPKVNLKKPSCLFFGGNVMYKKIIITAMLILGQSVVYTQDKTKARGISQPGRITSPKTEVKTPSETPQFEVEILFTEPSGDGVLGRDETGTLQFIVRNKSRFQAIDPKLDIIMRPSWTGQQSTERKLAAIQPGQDGTFKTSLQWHDSFSTGSFTIEATAVDTRSGAVSRPASVSFDVRAEAYVTERRLALVIGNSAYQNAGVLRNPVNDAEDLSNKLKKLGFDVDVRYDLKVNDLKRAIDEFGDRLPGYDVGLFYYAGHGAQAKGRNYLFPVDANPKTENDVEFECVRVDRILNKMEDAKCKSNLLILDACRNNPFERSWTRNGMGRGLAMMDAPSGSYIAFATKPNQIALDGSGRNGLYTEALLQHIGTPNITIDEMFIRVRNTVRKKSGDKQIPQEWTSLFETFYFLRR